MSTKLTPNAAEIRTDRTTLTTGNAPQTFDPFNTDPAPQMFAEKWQSNDS